MKMDTQNNPENRKTRPIKNHAEDSDFELLMNKVRDGSDSAAWDLVEQYGPYVLRAVRRNIRHEIRAKFDSQDFAQAVWTSFFDCSNQMQQVERPEQLVRLLATMARNKVIDEGRKRDTKRYCVKNETSMTELTQESNQGLKSKDPTPSQLAIVREQWEQVLEGQPSHYRRIAQLKLSGETNTAIADKLGINEKTVRRVLKELFRGQTE